ncbi:MAG: DUF1573 domain-containing protein [Chitinophagaceae bacterium]
MKKILGVLFITAAVAACNDVDKSKLPSPQAQQGESAEDTTQYTSIEWLENDKNMGTISEGQLLDVTFRFKNTGDKPLVIRSVRPSCGCTAANPPAEPIAPGSEGEIKASFNSQGRSGTNKKTLTVVANTKGGTTHELHFEVNVDAKKS